MTLYAANVMDVAKPIEKKTKKSKKVEAPVKQEEPAVEEPPREVLKELTPKQIAAAERRKRKREELEAAKQAEEEAIRAKEAEIEAKEAEIARKKEEAKERRRLAREAKKAAAQEATPATTESEGTTEEVLIEQTVAPKKRKRDDGEPPAWFQKYVAGVKQEEAKQASTKVPKRQVDEQARTVAQEQWKDGLTRDRIQNEVDGHMSRMYGMIFGNRRFK